MPISTWKKGDVPDEKRKKRMLLKWSIQNDDFRKKDRIFSNCFYLSKLLLTHLWLIHSAICENRDDQHSNLTGVKIKRRTFQPSGKERTLFFFKKLVILKDLFAFSTASDDIIYQITGSWKCYFGVVIYEWRTSFVWQETFKSSFEYVRNFPEIGTVSLLSC